MKALTNLWLVPVLLGIALLLFSAQAQPAEAGTIISNKAIVSYTDATGAGQSTESNTVNIEVLPVYVHDVKPVDTGGTPTNNTVQVTGLKADNTTTIDLTTDTTGTAKDINGIDDVPLGKPDDATATGNAVRSYNAAGDGSIDSGDIVAFSYVINNNANIKDNIIVQVRQVANDDTDAATAITTDTTKDDFDYNNIAIYTFTDTDGDGVYDAGTDTLLSQIPNGSALPFDMDDGNDGTGALPADGPDVMHLVVFGEIPTTAAAGQEGILDLVTLSRGEFDDDDGENATPAKLFTEEANKLFENNNLVSATVATDAELGSAKSLVSTTNNQDGTWDVVYRFVVENLGNADLDQIVVEDDLKTAFKMDTSGITFDSASVADTVDPDLAEVLTNLGYTTTNVQSVNTFVNNSFDGDADKEVIKAGTLGVRQLMVFDLTLVLNVPGTALDDTYENGATATGSDPTGPTTVGPDPTNCPADPSKPNSLNPDTNDDGNPDEECKTATPLDPEDDNPADFNKETGTIISNGDGTYNVPFTITVENVSDITLLNVQIIEDLDAAFKTADGTEVIGIVSGPTYEYECAADQPQFGPGGGLVRPPNFDPCPLVTTAGETLNPEESGSAFTGVSGTAEDVADAKLLYKYTDNPAGTASQYDLGEAQGSLRPGEGLKVTLTVRIRPAAGAASFSNKARFEAITPGGKKITDDATSVVGISEQPSIGAAKQASTPIDNKDGTFEITYLYTVKNYGNVDLENVTLTDDLVGQLGLTHNLGATTSGDRTQLAGGEYMITKAPEVSSNTFEANPDFNGAGDKDLLKNPASTGKNVLAQPGEVGDSVQVTMTVTLKPDSTSPKYENIAEATGESTETGNAVTDKTTDGTDPDPDDNGKPDEKTPTTTTPQIIPDLGIAKKVDITYEQEKGLDTSTTAKGDTMDKAGYTVFTVKYTLTIANKGNIELTDVQIRDRLAGTPGGTEPQDVPFDDPAIDMWELVEKSTPATGVFNGLLNAAFDGETDIDLLSGTADARKLDVGESGIILVTAAVEVRTDKLPLYNVDNQASGTGTPPGPGPPVTPVSCEGIAPCGTGGPNNTTAGTTTGTGGNPGDPCTTNCAPTKGTLVKPGNIKATKYQAICLNNGGQLDCSGVDLELDAEGKPTYTGDNPREGLTTSDGLGVSKGAAPGEFIVYHVVAEAAAGTVTDIVITDVIPKFTSYHDATTVTHKGATSLNVGVARFNNAQGANAGTAANTGVLECSTNNGVAWSATCDANATDVRLNGDSSVLNSAGTGSSSPIEGDDQKLEKGQALTLSFVVQINDR